MRRVHDTVQKRDLNGRKTGARLMKKTTIVVFFRLRSRLVKEGLQFQFIFDLRCIQRVSRTFRILFVQNVWKDWSSYERGYTEVSRTSKNFEIHNEKVEKISIFVQTLLEKVEISGKIWKMLIFLMIFMIFYRICYSKIMKSRHFQIFLEISTFSSNVCTKIDIFSTFSLWISKKKCSGKLNVSSLR